jgi:hypothetical protein
MASPLRTLAWLPLAALLLWGSANAQTTNTPAALRERHAQLAAEMENTAFKRPVVLQSSETGNQLQGSIDAVVAQPFALASEHLQRPAALCEILMLQINTKQCTVAGNVLDVRIGRKHDQPLEDAYRVAFNVQPRVSNAEYMNLRLGADSGPFSTRDYRIQLQAIPIEGGSKTFLHLEYSYGIGLPARLAMQGYLATLGAGKVGFTRTSSTGYIGGMRGAVERNTMRYYLAIDAYLASLAAPPAQQRARRLEAWFTATEQYARQLHELDRADYLALKQVDFRRLPAAG